MKQWVAEGEKIQALGEGRTVEGGMAREEPPMPGVARGF